MFMNGPDTERLYRGYVGPEAWKPFPDIADRAGWTRPKQDPRLQASVDAIIRIADEVTGHAIDPLPATLYMDFIRNGDRQAYEDRYFRRRAHLSHLVIAECLTAEGRYLDPIIDHIWAILGEPYWCVPAHNFAGQHEMVMYKTANPWKDDDPLPVPGEEYLDLFNCETAAILAEACYLLKPLLLERVPSLYHLVHRQIAARTLSLLEGPNLYGWYNGLNNWTVWCAHNLLTAACYVVDDRDRLISIVQKLLPPMQRFFDNLEESGSCIEGPTYWVVSAGRLVGFIDLVEKRFGVKFGFEDSTKFRNFGAHLVQLHIAGNKYVNFADGNLKIDLDHGLLSRYAEMIGAQSLTNLIWQDVARVAPEREERLFRETGHADYVRQILIHLTRLLFWTPEIAEAPDRTYRKSLWLSDMQVMVAREYPEVGKGLMLSAIAGSNDPKANHHSHNDIGHFNVYLDGAPLLIDLGQSTYSKATFAAGRYDMWHISSEGHAVPKINGLVQRAGSGTDASDVAFSDDEGASVLSLDAAPAYFEAVGSNRVRRRIVFDHRKASVHVEDDVSLEAGLTSFELPLYVSDRDISVEAAGACRIRCGARLLRIVATNLRLDGVDRLPLSDPRHRDTWGEAVHRLRYVGEDLRSGRFALDIRVED
ncbi:conserved hypothetical protein [uncultured Pleomorphomonas sp.]|uniref:Heparinase II/III-like C-terminal domain-containing protein n=2 Tax=uncultured Pleomorphomonas sp. TaxID=442121 RepID=A0A212LEY7_9HYPH|nr:conserved hypothetical protein [uncultured Pleomorphomonas sp.]